LDIKKPGDYTIPRCLHFKTVDINSESSIVLAENKFALGITIINQN
jgi:hypothetical protein